MRLNLSLRGKLFLSHFLAVLLVSGSIGTYFYHSAVDSLMTNLQGRLLNSAALISRSVDARDLENIREKADTARPEYQKTLTLLRDLRKTNPDIAFLYLMRRVGDKAQFVVDSDETEKQAQPGRIYQQDIPSLMAGFDRPSVDQDIFTDQWGSFLSGYAPVKNGAGRYLIGLDMRADEVEQKFHQLRISGIVSLAFSIVLAFLFSRSLSRRLVTGIDLMVNHCMEISEGRLGGTLDFRTGDEFNNLVKAFNTMSAKLDQGQRALQEARDQMEARVEERTRELTEVNRQLREEMDRREEAQEALAQAARTDPLTGLLNRRALSEHLERLLAVHRRNAHPLVVLMADLDKFKRINDTHGHLAGDRVLQEVSRIMGERLRGQDLLGRWGGEEFLIVLPETGMEGGLKLAEELRAAVEAQSGRIVPDGQGVTLSLGAALLGSGIDADHLITAADNALYQAKAQGRNRVAGA